MRSNDTTAHRNEHVVIVGSGFAGLGLAIQLKRAGIDDFTILERSDRVGGVWRDNTYPGLCCDVPSHLYSFSFEPNPSWSRVYSPQAEILAYLERCAVKYGVLSHIRFGTTVTSARFDEGTGLWSVFTSAGTKLDARVLVSAAGHALSKPVLPNIEGRDTFAGKSMHSARWDHEYSLDGRTVAVVGTGASAVQIIPTIAPKVRAMHVFQRTAAWVMPKLDRDVAPAIRNVFARAPVAQMAARCAIYLAQESLAPIALRPALGGLVERYATKYLHDSVTDPDLRAKLTPTFRPGCKRMLLSNDYYPALQRANVEVVTDRIAEIRAHSVVTADGRERPVDTIVYATGYEAAEAKPPFEVVGRHGQTLADAWHDGGEAYLATTVSGFPNFFLILGPNVGLGHNSMIFMMESQFAYVLGAIKDIRARALAYVDLRLEHQQRYNAWIQKRLENTVWNSGGCQSWYLTQSGKNTTMWPGFTFEYRVRTRRFDREHYECVERHGVRAAAPYAGTAQA